MKTPIRALIVAATFLYCMSLYPAVLHETERKGSDAPIYWEAGRGNTEYVCRDNDRDVDIVGWVYSDRVLVGFHAIAGLPYPWFLAAIHLANSLGIACVMAAALDRIDRYPIAAGAVAMLVGATASDVLANGNVTGMLIGMSLTPIGAVLACAVKPYFAVAVVLHAAGWLASRAGNDAEVDNAERVSVSVGGVVRIDNEVEAGKRWC